MDGGECERVRVREREREGKARQGKGREDAIRLVFVCLFVEYFTERFTGSSHP